jgi:hypothetical protein
LENNDFDTGVHNLLYIAGPARCGAALSVFGLAFCENIGYIFYGKGNGL